MRSNACRRCRSVSPFFSCWQRPVRPTACCSVGRVRGSAQIRAAAAGELAGYLCVIVPVATLAAQLLQAHPAIAGALKLCAAAWILVMAFRLWRPPAQAGKAGTISAWQVFVTTLFNPKALVIALVIMPHADLPALLPWLAGVCGLVLLAASGWIFAGSMARRLCAGAATPHMIRRITAVCLTCFAMVMAVAAVAAILPPVL